MARKGEIVDRARPREHRNEAGFFVFKVLVVFYICLRLRILISLSLLGFLIGLEQIILEIFKASKDIIKKYENINSAYVALTLISFLFILILIPILLLVGIIKVLIELAIPPSYAIFILTFILFIVVGFVIYNLASKKKGLNKSNNGGISNV